MAVTTIRGGRQIQDGTVPYADIQTAAANSVLGNDSNAARALQEITLANSNLLGRGVSPNNVTAITVTNGIEFSGTAIQTTANLRSLNGLTYTAAAFVKMTAANTFSLDTNTYLTSAVTTITFGSTGLTPSSASSGAVTVAGTLVVGNGGTGVTSVTTTPTASAFAGWDANKNLLANNHVNSYTTTATAAGTTTLTVGSTYYQYFTGTTTQTVQLPVVTTLSNGFTFNIVNQSTGLVTVQTSGANQVVQMTSNSQLTITCINTAGGTGTASWTWTYGVYSSNTGVVRSTGTLLQATSTSFTPDVSLYDTFFYSTNGSAITITFNAPTPSGSLLVQGQRLIIRVKDNGTNTSTLAWNAVYRASTDLTLPTTTTLGKTQYFGFIYNATDTRWDLVAKLNNI